VADTIKTITVKRENKHWNVIGFNEENENGLHAY